MTRQQAGRTSDTGHRGSIRIGRIAGIDVLVHWSFLILLVIVAATASSSGALVWAAVWIIAIFGSVLVHELAHSLVARARGAVVLDILLLPIGGLSQISEMPESPRDELAIAVVGPLASLALALVFFLGGLTVHVALWPPTIMSGPWVARLAWLNALLGTFNLLPALPMDGGRVLRAALARRHGRAAATAEAAGVARIMAVAMVVVGFLYDIWLVLIGLFVLLGANAEESAAKPPRGPRPPSPAEPRRDDDRPVRDPSSEGTEISR